MKNMLIKQYFSIVFGMVMLFSLIPVHAMQQEKPMIKQQEVVSQSYWTRFKNFLHRTLLFPGWRSTEAQKAAAEEKLANLLVEREKLEDERKLGQLSDERLQEISKELKRINDEIKKQENILRQRWNRNSVRRLAAAGGLGLAAVLGAKYAMSSALPSSPFAPSFQNAFNELVKDKKFRWEVRRKFNNAFLDYETGNIQASLTNDNVSEKYILQFRNKETHNWKDAGYTISYKITKGKWKIERQ